ncbi:Putative ribonuclease H protein [Dendrobium catenatum]|uniref:Ribonuclease H protein n=1 Tax=Dendrobium catenatum TaxID=906689 RepID=A0A2I0WBZ7_9ASPA|nr:Putative ribonuclease H protein [Dendrobium catenatum]
MSNGEDDLKFLYSRINTRHNSNLIKSITNSEGDFTISADINNVNVNHFQKIFNTNIPPSSSTWTAPIHLKLPSNLIPQLVSPITVEEIKNVVFSSPKCSTPGPDGYTFEFYKSTWNTIGKQLCKAVLTFFSTGSMPKHAKATAIALIPKRPHAQDIADYRPISPCNNFYKIIAKILANRMKEVMPSIIHPSQSGFNKDRVISDNILLVAELLKDFNSSSKNQYFCVKFDIHKAFDTVSRNFLIDRMLAKGFPYAFADDLLVFAKDSLDNAHYLNNFLNNFASISSLQVNSNKINILLSKNVTNDEAIYSTLNIPISTAPVKYLGILIFHRRLKICDYQPLLEKISGSLDGWKARNLSFVGRLQYHNYTINNILAYWVRGTFIPKTCVKTIKSLCSRFLYYGDIHKRGLHMISWKDTCKPKIHGGLGIHSIESLYYAFGGTVVWRFLNSNSYLISWWKEKYGSFWNYDNSKCSIYWKALCDVAKCLLHSLNFKIITFNHLSFFWDPWCFGQSVADRLKQANLEFLITSTNLAVSSHINNGCWNLPPNFPTHLAAMINSVPICNSSDECCWTKPAKPSFRNFIKLFYEEFEVVPWYKFVWHKHYSLRFSIYSWFAFKNWLKTVDALTARGIPDSPHCVFCKSGRETKNHLLFECDFTFNILKCFLPRMNSMLMRPNLGQIFNDMDDLETDCNRKNFCFLLIYAIVYYTWRARNDRLFGNNIECLTTITSKIKKVVYLKTFKKKCFQCQQFMFT